MAKKITAERQLELQYEEKLKGLHNIPEAIYLYEVGDSVSIGNLDNCIVLEVLQDGRLYKVEYDSFRKGSEHLREIGFWYWIDVRPPYHNDSHGFIKQNILQLHYQQRSVEGLLWMVYGSGVDMNPEYQREYAWTYLDQQALVHSIFQGYDIGKFVFVKIPWKNSVTPAHEVLDGKQRLNALLGFYEGLVDYEGVYFNQLSRREQYHFTSHPVSFAEIDKATMSQKLDYFITLNTTGRVMDENTIFKAKLKLNSLEGFHENME